MNEPKTIQEIKPEYVRAAHMSAAGRGLKFPSIEFDEYVAKFLSGIKAKD